ncbi:serine/threonine-protein phosphatase [Planomonospora sp. ID91781]|uniref:protein-serine/threonine phosphatase n=1 Tax=Planomonospora sphaerica TaxID=161355 RepID=A0A161MFH7_9ACTN|nr:MULTISPECIES: ATP-binding SpoIIE family protein phosphatase [Planomonospora]MBG0826055.1 serine/threonine-protein phosphatase [Planomonospora sp. ID91781]GAT71173.1 protein phosphatase 2C [Planomonospora sphaerica]
MAAEPAPERPPTPPAVPPDLVFLHRATARLAEADDPATAARLLCAELVPHLADAALVHLADPPGPACRPPGGHRRAAALSTGAPGTPDPAAHLAAAADPSPGNRARAAGQDGGRNAGPGTHALAVPLEARGQRVGGAVLTRGPARPPFDGADALVAGQLAAVAALTVHHAHVELAHEAVTEVVRQSLRPAPPPPLPGVDLAHRYRPGDQRMLVGGDWFDVIPLSGCRVALVVGDVMGHGLEAAAIMAQLRTSVQTLAALELPPDQVLRSLDDIARRLADDSITTCLYAVYDPVARRCSIASAGHLPPVLVRRDGTAELLDPGPSTGLPIGLGRPPIETTEIAAEDGCTLVLYTDGLVECRGDDIGDRLERLRATAGTADGPLEKTCDALMAQAAGTEDDVTLLMARFRGIPSEHVAGWFLEPHNRTPGQVRALVRRTLHEWGLEHLSGRVEAAAGELVANACRHATRLVSVRLVLTDVVLFEVGDDDHRLPVLRSPGDLDESGRGLHVVAGLTERWGSTRVAGGKTVWFTCGT